METIHYQGIEVLSRCSWEEVPLQQEQVINSYALGTADSRGFMTKVTGREVCRKQSSRGLALHIQMKVLKSEDLHGRSTLRVTTPSRAETMEEPPVQTTYIVP